MIMGPVGEHSETEGEGGSERESDREIEGDREGEGDLEGGSGGETGLRQMDESQTSVLVVGVYIRSSTVSRRQRAGKLKATEQRGTSSSQDPPPDPSTQRALCPLTAS